MAVGRVVVLSCVVEVRVPNLRDGRLPEFRSNDVERRDAVIFHQSTLLDTSSWTSWLAELAQRGVRAAAFNRSGYGRSSPKRERRTVDIGRDVGELAEHLGLSRFVSAGWSGGGSHALATALDPRCDGVVTLAGIAPFAQDDLDFYAGMKADDVAEYHAALRNIDELLAMIADPEHANAWCEPDTLAMTTPAMGENVPLDHARWLHRHIRGSRLELYPGEGHLSLGLTHHVTS